MRAKFWEVPDEVWAFVEPWIPKGPSRARGGRPRLDNRRILEGIVFRMKTRCDWAAIPEQFGSSSTLQRRYEEWSAAGVFHLLFFAFVHHFSATPDADLSWCLPEGVTLQPRHEAVRGIEIRPSEADELGFGRDRDEREGESAELASYLG